MLRAERTDATEANEPMERIDPADPMDRIDPVEPIDRIDPVEPMDRIDPLEPMLISDPAEPSEFSELDASPMPGFSHPVGLAAGPCLVIAAAGQVLSAATCVSHQELDL
jgi:hypothetical protein